MAWIMALLLLAAVRSIRGDEVNVGDSFNFTVSEICTGDFKLMKDIERTVATRVHGAWEAEKPYEDRIEHVSTRRVALTRVNVNDNGLYEFMCDGQVVRVVQLEVILPIHASVAEGETIKLPCYFVTAAEPVKTMRWERDGKLLLQVDSFGRITNGTGSDKRASVSSDWNLTGDLTLTLTRAQLEDQGEYICYIGTSTRGNPAAVRLEVTKRTPDQTTFAHPPESHISPPLMCLTAAVVCLVALLPAAASFGWWLKSRRSSGPGVEELVVMAHLPNGVHAAQDNEESERLANGYH